MVSERISLIKGDKGDKGAASTVPGPPGLPGVNAVPTAKAVAAYLNDPSPDPETNPLPGVLAAKIETGVESAISTPGPPRDALDTLIAEGIIDSGIGAGGDIVQYIDHEGYPVIVTALVPPPTAPAAPVIGTVTAADNQIAVPWTAPIEDPRAPILDYQNQYKASADSTWLTFPHAASLALTRTITGLTNGTLYDTRVAAINAVGVGSYSEVRSIAPGAVNGVVASDTFTRTSTDVVGTSPTTGPHPYAGATGQFQVDGSRMIGKSTAAGTLVTLDIGARGDLTAIGTLNVSTLANAAATGHRHYLKWGGSSNYFYFDIGVTAAGVGAVSVKLNANNAGLVTLANFPVGTLPSTTAEADYAFSCTLNADGFWSLTFNGTTRSSVTTSRPLTATERGFLASITTVAYTNAAGNNTNVKLDNVSYSVNGYKS